MSVFVLVEGEPGSGKSTSLRTLDPKETVIIKPNQKPLPFKGGGNLYSKENKNLFMARTFPDLKKIMENVNAKAPHVKNLVIEDLTHIFSAREMADAHISGYQKWADMAQDAYSALIEPEDTMREDLFVFIIAHTNTGDDGMGGKKVGLQTPGKMLENKIKIPSYFTYVLHAIVRVVGERAEYKFLTQTDGIREAKSPMGCLNRLEDNDMQVIRDKIVAYQEGVDYQPKENKNDSSQNA